MMFLKKGFFCIAMAGVVFLSGCKDNASEKYIGTWKNNDSQRPSKTWVIWESKNEIMFSQQVKEYTPVITSATFKDGSLLLGTGMGVVFNSQDNTLSLNGDPEKFYKVSK